MLNSSTWSEARMCADGECFGTEAACSISELTSYGEKLTLEEEEVRQPARPHARPHACRRRHPRRTRVKQCSATVPRAPLLRSRSRCLGAAALRRALPHPRARSPPPPQELAARPPRFAAGMPRATSATASAPTEVLVFAPSAPGADAEIVRLLHTGGTMRAAERAEVVERLSRVPLFSDLPLVTLASIAPAAALKVRRDTPRSRPTAAHRCR